MKTFSCCILLALTLSAAAVFAEPARNVLLFIGDGMGPEQAGAAGMYLNGSSGTLCFEALPARGFVTTRSSDSEVTDSAAAATAMAAGRKVNNGVISVALPGDGSELRTVLELFRSGGRSAGLVSTKNITDATPAAFGAHEEQRGSHAAIARGLLEQAKPEVLLGGGGSGMTPEAAAMAGYTVVTDSAGLYSLDLSTIAHLSGQFGSGPMPYEMDGTGSLPRLVDMTVAALGMLSGDPDGFFLMVEGGKIDSACHVHNIKHAVTETAAFAEAVQAGLDWAAANPDTLVLVTADHETGGLRVKKNRGRGRFPGVKFSTLGHTGVNVGIFASGPGSERVAGVIDNTDIFGICAGR